LHATQSVIPPVNPPTPQLFFETVNGFQRTEALKAAIELEVFAAIGENNNTPAAIAQRCSASERGIRILCDYLTIHGFLSKTAQGYQMTPDSAMFLDKRSPAYVGGAIRFLLSPRSREAFGTLTDAVRKGGTALEHHSLEPEHPMWIDFARGMAPLMKMPAEALARFLRADQQNPWRVLGLAVGHGMYEITLAVHNRKAQVYVVDWPNVLTVARENAEAAGISDRYHTIPGSAFDVNYGTDYDVAVITNFIHHFEPATCEMLLRKVHAALKPGGRVVILDFVPNEDRVSPAMPAGFSLTMLAGTPSGDAYTFSQYQTMLKNAGYSSSELHPLIPNFSSVVVAYK
jgi:ubiquinone/menaquinone biosynthesis C-methylase UbiE